MFTAALVASKCYMIYHDKNDPIISQQSGYSWTLERLNTRRSYKLFRMDSQLFYQLHDLLGEATSCSEWIHSYFTSYMICS
jgi:hypothetical protein